MPLEESALLQHPDYRWVPNGQSIYRGDLLALYHQLDRLFQRWGQALRATDYSFPTFISAETLAKLDYFQHFPHLITVPVTLDPAQENLEAFARENKHYDASAGIALSETKPIQEVLTPAACYHFYPQFQEENLDTAYYLTTRATCFRHEAFYAPLQRQWSFSMREIVCLGNMAEVTDFLEQFKAKLESFFQEIGLPVRWETATDPFFNPSKNPKYLLQKLEPVKTEMILGDGLAIGSINFHRNYFGEAFKIQRDAQAAFSGCVAFGLDRWIYAILTHFGPTPDQWPVFAGQEPLGHDR